MEKREWKPIEGFNFEEILFEEYNHIAKVTINRPRYRNAFTARAECFVASTSQNDHANVKGFTTVVECL